jgi:hypothetical protein
MEHHESTRDLSTVFIWDSYHAHVRYVFMVKEVALKL